MHGLIQTLRVVACRLSTDTALKIQCVCYNRNFLYGLKHTLRMPAFKLSPDCPAQTDVSGACCRVRGRALTDRSRPRCLCPAGLLRSDCHGDTGNDLQLNRGK